MGVDDFSNLRSEQLNKACIICKDKDGKYGGVIKKHHKAWSYTNNLTKELWKQRIIEIFGGKNFEFFENLVELIGSQRTMICYLCQNQKL